MALKALGFAAGDSIMAMFSVHVLSQLVDYGLGIFAYGVFSLRAPAVATASAPAPRRRLLRTASALFVLLAGLAFAAYQVRNLRKMGSLTPPGTGQDVVFSADDAVVRAEVLPVFRGRVVWSSNRSGQHDLWMLTLPKGEITQLTDHPHTETYPRFSPDGRRIVFCRSQQPWVSQRNPGPWDTYVLDLDTKASTLVATHAFTPTWTPDGRGVVFVRDGVKVMRQSLDSASEPEALAAAGAGSIAQGVIFQTPESQSDGTLAVTLRGAMRGPALCRKGEIAERIGSGCQLGWLPGAGTLVYVSDGGRMKNAFYRHDRGTAERTVLFDSPGEFSHEYFPRMSKDGKWLVYGASQGDHEHDTADYEVFLWQVGSPMASAARLTAHSGNDCWPDVFGDE
jgi:hypothetical protein